MSSMGTGCLHLSLNGLFVLICSTPYIETVNGNILESLVSVSPLQDSLLGVLLDLRMNVLILLRLERLIYAFTLRNSSSIITLRLVLLIPLFSDLILQIPQLFEVGSNEVLIPLTKLKRRNCTI